MKKSAGKRERKKAVRAWAVVDNVGILASSKWMKRDAQNYADWHKGKAVRVEIKECD